MLTGVANAAFDSIPMVSLIAENVPCNILAAPIRKLWREHGDGTQCRILEPVVKQAWRVDDPESSWRKSSDKAFG